MNHSVTQQRWLLRNVPKKREPEKTLLGSMKTELCVIFWAMVDDCTSKNSFCLVTFCVICFMHCSLCFLLLQWDSSPSNLLVLPCHFLCKTSAITSTGYVTRDVVKMPYDHATKVPERLTRITHAEQILWNNDSLDVIIVFKTEAGLVRLSGELF